MHIQNLPFKGYFYTAFAISAILVIIVLISIAILPPVVPLFYGRPVGSEQLAPTLGLLFIPAATALVSLGNLFIASGLKHEFLRKILASASLFISILGAITLIKIIMLVGFW